MKYRMTRTWLCVFVAFCLVFVISAAAQVGQQSPQSETSTAAQRAAGAAAQADPAEPPQGHAAPKLLPRPAGAIPRSEIDEAGMRSLIAQLVNCGTRNSLGDWNNPTRGPGCARDHVVARLNEIAKSSGGRMQVVVDKFEATSERTGNKPVPMENFYGILPGADPQLAKTIFIVSGHFDT